jgi:hypothetical protein
MPAESPRPRSPRQNPAATADTLLNVRQKYMPPAIAHFEVHADCQGIWSKAMTIRTTEVRPPEYSEAEITTTAMTDHRAFCHSKNIPEAHFTSTAFRIRIPSTS